MNGASFRVVCVSSALILALFLDACRETADPKSSSQADQVARELAAAQFNKANRSLVDTRKALAPLVERKDAALRDLVHAAVVELEAFELPRAKALLERAASLDATDAALNYNLGRLAELESDVPAAAAAFRKALEAAPGDTPTKLHLASLIDEDEPQEAERLLREVLASGLENEGPWYVSALYRLSRLLSGDAARQAESDELGARYSGLIERGLKAPSDRQFAVGNLGSVAWPGPTGTAPASAGHTLSLAAPVALAPELAGAARLLACDLDNDGKLDLVGYGPRGVGLALQSSAQWRGRSISAEAAQVVLVHDFANDDTVDLVIAGGAALTYWRAGRAADGSLEWRALRADELTLVALPSPPHAGLAVDFDHEGDLDLLFVGDFGARLYRNDGATRPGGAFTDVTESAGLPRQGSFEWCAIEDFDTDQDVDLLLGGSQDLSAFSNLRGGTFEHAPHWFAGAPSSPIAHILADLDGDTRPDLWSARDGAVSSRRFDGTLKPGPAPRGLDGLTAAREILALDLDLNGALDVAWTRGERLEIRYDAGLASARSGILELGTAAGGVLVEDLDGDLAWDVCWPDERGVVLRRGAIAHANALRLAFRGRKDNRRGVGAVVELRAGPTYLRTFWRGEPTLLGVGEARATDVLRVLWPNGVHQYDLRPDLGDRAATDGGPHGALEQPEGLVGSCPFLYVWNGREYEFISDVLGTTPLGLPMAPGMLVPPDHDEYVLVKGEQLVPREGRFELQFTEELREVTYLDRVRLEAVDSPQGSEVFPSERFCFPPFPAPHTHVVQDALAPLMARGSDGVDWSKELAAVDECYAAPFQPAPSQFLGLATPHWVELEFDAARVRAANKLRLIATGWFYWTDASVNVASAFDPTQEFVPPLLQVLGQDDQWRPAGPPLGFPAGKTKTMVVDITALVPRDIVRFRLFSTLRLYWDSVRLAIDDDTTPTRTSSLEPQSAQLWRRGFSRSLPARSQAEPERFDWETLSERPRWNQHPGLYTRYGECLELLTAIDDRMVIMGSGDALTVSFDASYLPPLPDGWRRDYLVFLDGWAKDRDPNTVGALRVEPLPFHGMSGYPYGPDESFPDTPEHRDWRREWNTRPGVDLIESLAPAQR